MAEPSAPIPVKYSEKQSSLDDIRQHALATYPGSRVVWYRVNPVVFDYVWDRLRPKVVDKGTRHPGLEIPIGRHDLVLWLDPDMPSDSFCEGRP